jgi:hypothetical protein
MNGRSVASTKLTSKSYRYSAEMLDECINCDNLQKGLLQHIDVRGPPYYAAASTRRSVDSLAMPNFHIVAYAASV